MFHCITCGLVAVLSVLASEVVLRLSGRVTVESVATAGEDRFESIPGMFEPGQRAVERPRAELRHRVSINAMGYRGPDHDLGDRGRVRLLCLGDSFTYGSYLDDEHTLPAQLEQTLRAKGYPVDVINAGVGGTTIVDQLYVLRKAAQIDVDIAILVFSENDIADLAKDEPMVATAEKNRRVKATPVVSEVHSLVRNTALFNPGLEFRGWYRSRRSPEVAHAEGRAQSDDTEALWRRYDLLFGEMQANVAARGAEFVFVVFPSHYRSDARARGDDRVDRVEGLARRRGARIINLLHALREAADGAGGLYLLPYDGHPSARGYAVAARAVAAELDTDVRNVSGRLRSRLVTR
jgi:lysophospholipase L1-like esterase